MTCCIMAIGHTKAAAGDMFSSDTALTISGNGSTISDELDPDCLLVHMSLTCTQQ